MYNNYEEFKQDVISGKYELDLTNLKYGTCISYDVNKLPAFVKIEDGILKQVRRPTQEDYIELLKQDRLDIRLYMPIDIKGDE